MVGVLFVCLGNICRSPTAEGMFLHKIEQAGLSGRFVVDSAGMQGWHTGSPPDSRAIEAAVRRGYSLAGLAARAVRAQDFEDFDYILGMDASHKRGLEALAPAGSKAHVGLLLDYAQDVKETEVPDPYYGGEAAFEYALDLIEYGTDGVLRHLGKELAL